MMILGRWAGIALFLTVASAAPCVAQDTDTTGAGPGRGGVGGQIGGSYFVAAGDYSAGAEPRFDFSGHWRYVFRPWLRLQLSPGFTWSAYDKHEPVPFQDLNFPADQTKQHYLTCLVPVSVQAQLTRRRGRWIYHAGAGPGLYRVWVQNRRKVLQDPQTLKLHRGLYPGMSAEVGFERFLTALPSTSIEFAVTGHFVFAVRDDQFPSGFNDNLAAVGARIGGNYYFNLHRKRPATTLPLRGVER